jgi:hypothetical protein
LTAADVRSLQEAGTRAQTARTGRGSLLLRSRVPVDWRPISSG